MLTTTVIWNDAKDHADYFWVTHWLVYCDQISQMTTSSEAETGTAEISVLVTYQKRWEIGLPLMGKIFWSQIKICSNINMIFCSTSAPDHSCCQPSETVVTLQVFTTVVNTLRRSEAVVNNYRPLCWQQQSFGMMLKSNERWASFFSPWLEDTDTLK